MALHTDIRAIILFVNTLIIEIGGCGAMYNMEVESELFKGKTLVAQHRMVNQVRVCGSGEASYNERAGDK